jgi:hypothetical protein
MEQEKAKSSKTNNKRAEDDAAFGGALPVKKVGTKAGASKSTWSGSKIGVHHTPHYYFSTTSTQLHTCTQAVYNLSS